MINYLNAHLLDRSLLCSLVGLGLVASMVLNFDWGLKMEPEVSADWTGVGFGMALRVKALEVLSMHLNKSVANVHLNLAVLLGFHYWEDLRVAHRAQGPHGTVHRQLEALVGPNSYTVWKILEARDELVK